MGVRFHRNKQLKEERRQLFEEANKLSLVVEPKTYRDKKTTYKVWDHHIEGCRDGYGKKIRVIVSDKTTTKRSYACDGIGWQEKTEIVNWMWVTNLFPEENADLDDLKNTVKVCHVCGRLKINASGEIVNIWNADHIYRHSENAILAFLLLLFTCVNIFNIFHARNIKDRNIKTKVFLIEKIKTEFFAIKKPLPPVPV